MGRQLRNIIVLGLAFMCVFTAFQTCSMVQKNVTEAVHNSTNGSYTGNGYTSLVIIYGVFGPFNWLAPSIVALIGSKWTMLIGAITYALFIGQFLYPMTWALYAASALVGVGAAVLWTAQGSFYSKNSSPETTGRDSGIFWALFQISLLIGNIYQYVVLRGDSTINDEKRILLFAALTGICCFGLVLLCFLDCQWCCRSSGTMIEGAASQDPIVLRFVDENIQESPLRAFVKSVRMFCTLRMLLLSVCFAYTGLELTFFSGVYTSAVGHTLAFGTDLKGYIGITGICIGGGEILGGSLFGIFGSRTRRFGRDPIILLGLICHLAAFYLIYLVIPDDAPSKDTSLLALLTDRDFAKYLAFLSGFLLGFGDSCFNTQSFDILGSLYRDDESAPAFCLFKFTQSLAAAVGFFYSGSLSLRWQLVILVVMAVVGSFCFFVVEWMYYYETHRMSLIDLDYSTATQVGSMNKADDLYTKPQIDTSQRQGVVNSAFLTD